MAWRDLLACFGPWQMIWKRHRRFSIDDTWDKIHKAYSSRGNRAMIRARRVKTVIPQHSDQTAHRKRWGAAGGRPPAFDPIA